MGTDKLFRSWVPDPGTAGIAVGTALNATTIMGVPSNINRSVSRSTWARGAAATTATAAA